jgi:simple sugar transport system permease protein
MVGVILFFTDIPLPGLLGNSLVRFFMNGVLVLSLVPMMNAGVGINYGLPIGILAGLLGMCLAVNFGLGGLTGFITSITFSVLISLPFGYGYARVLDRARGEEEITGLFFGFAAVFIMSFFWAIAPFSNPEMLWPIGGEGLRPTIGLGNYFSHALNDLGAFNIGTLQFPTGGILFFLGLCYLLYLFSRTKTGWALDVVGANQSFARFSGVDVNRSRTLAIIFSTILGAVGICVYAQSYGFLDLYDAPLMMAFPAASAILLGGSSGGKTTVAQVMLGTFLFQTVYVFSGPLANALLVPEMSEITRVIITSGIILYALLYQGGKKG